MKTEEIKKKLKEYFTKYPEIEVAYIFGSVAQDRANILSDIDIAIIVDRDQINEETYQYGYKAEILTNLMKLLKTNKVDLVMLDEANILLKHRVLYFGQLVYSKSERRRIEFQTNTIDRYSDFKKLVKPFYLKNSQ